MKEDEDINEGLLLFYLKENLENARHVEWERMTFNAIFMTLVGGALIFLKDSNSFSMSYIILLLLILLNVICIFLTTRWSDVFDGHNDIIKKIHERIMKKENHKEKDINENYLFDNKAALKIKRLENKEHPYIRTRHYFAVFNYTTLSILILAFIITLFQ